MPIELFVLGSFRSLPALLYLNSSSPFSLINRDYVTRHNLPFQLNASPTNPRYCTGLIAAPSASDYAFVSSIHLSVDTLPLCDILLGQDWLAQFCPRQCDLGLLQNEEHTLLPPNAIMPIPRIGLNGLTSTYIQHSVPMHIPSSVLSTLGFVPHNSGCVPSSSGFVPPSSGFVPPSAFMPPLSAPVPPDLNSPTIESPSPHCQPSVFANTSTHTCAHLRYVTDTLLGVDNSPSLFNLNEQLLRQLLIAHESLPNPTWTLQQCQRLLIRHLVLGSCYDTANNGNLCARLVGDLRQPEPDFIVKVVDRLCATTTKTLSTKNMAIISESLGCTNASMNARSLLKVWLKSTFLKSPRYIDGNATSPLISPFRVMAELDKLPRNALASLATLHALQTEGLTVQSLHSVILTHLSDGSCIQKPSLRSACSDMCIEYTDMHGHSPLSALDLKIYALQSLCKSLKLRALKRLLRIHNIDFQETDSLSRVRSHLRKHIGSLKKGKSRPIPQPDAHSDRAHASTVSHDTSEWPQLIPTQLKDKIVNLFKEATSHDTLSEFVCASCAASSLCSGRSSLRASVTNLTVFEFQSEHSTTPLKSDGCPLSVPFQSGPLANLVLEPLGINNDSPADPLLHFCKPCATWIKRKTCNKPPPLSLANTLYLGPVPSQLNDLTVVEEAMIARCRAKSWIIQLKEEDQNRVSPNVQRGLKGNIIVYPQRPEAIARVLPPSLDEITTPICVVFIGSKPPSAEWLRNNAKPLVVRREKVRSALEWLKSNNPFYENIEINHDMLNSLENEQILPVSIEHQLPNHATDLLTSTYDPIHAPENNSTNTPSSGVPFQNVVITDVDGSAPSNELRAAAIRHMKQKGGGYIEIPHDPLPVNEFFNPDLFPMIYPTLFPYGIGGFEDPRRKTPISLKCHVKHLFNLADRRFQEHYSFLFTAFNLLQRRTILLHTGLKVKRANFEAVSNAFATVSVEAVHTVTERVSKGDFKTANSPEEARVLRLMKEINVITSHVPGSSASRLVMRNEIRGLITGLGAPSFYITINPADVFNPLVKFLAGSDIDIDALLPEQVPDFWQQSILVAKNPAVAAKFFNIYMKAFISAVLGYESNDGGILGHTKGYYGCVEAQGRGTLHCHMLIWVEGGLNPDEIKSKLVDPDNSAFQQRLIQFLEDTILNCVPPDPGDTVLVQSSTHHPCSVRGPSFDLPGDVLAQARAKDLHNLVKQCQQHSHSKTCYKYWKGPPNPKECRFDLDASNSSSHTMVDPETGEITLRCLDGMVNNFNSTIIEAVRCNMDIKFIGSGASAKAVLYYITDYVTKSQLKTHIAFAALELAVKKLGDFDPESDEKTIRAKRLLQKCAHAMISHQELSAQQVSSYLMDYEDHFTSHSFRNLFWTNFERLIDSQDPSPECYTRRNSLPIEQNEYTGDLDIEMDLLPDHSAEELPSDGVHNVMEDEANDEELAIEVVDSTNIAAKSDTVSDYCYRPLVFDKLCVWDCIAHVEKFKLSAKERSSVSDVAMTDVQHDRHSPDLCDAMEFELPASSSLIGTIDDYLASGSPVRQRGHFLSEHLECATHMARLRMPKKTLVPVPMGPSIPCRDRVESRAKYCRLMLILFKPWRSAADLRKKDQSWADAFDEFKLICSPRHLSIMNNMQVLHECRDSRDDHFANRRRRTRVSQEFMQGAEDNDDFVNENVEEEILEHLNEIDASRSLYSQLSSDNVTACINAAANGGMFDRPVPTASQLSISEIIVENSPIMVEDDPIEERLWKHAYEERKNMRKKSSVVEVSSDASAPIIEAVIRNLTTGVSEIRTPSVRQDLPQSVPEYHIDLEAMVAQYSLNVEQARAFHIVCNHSLMQGKDPLRMFLGGAGGTGKSRVIKAIDEFFRSRNQARRFRLAAFTGVAARNINGMTLHSALLLHNNSRSKSNAKSLRDLTAMWEGVDYFLIDEISMVGCNLLLDISDALAKAKGNSSPFGGINIILAGDFAQLPPVGQVRLSARINTALSATTRGQRAIFGKLLWLQFNTVVLLKQPMRQFGPENQEFVSLLQRLRQGTCTQADHDLLSSRMLQQIRPNFSSDTWRTAPVIVSDNATKDALNEHAAAAFARETGQELHWYYATDTHRGKPLTSEFLLDEILRRNSGQTGQRLGRLPLVIGMPVVISHNFDVSSGVVNGSKGILRGIRYQLDVLGRRVATSCIIELSEQTDAELPGLPKNHVAALQDSSDLKFVHPHSGRSCTIKRLQVPIQPGFAMTAHRAQGQTLSNVIVDLKGCRGTESPYVMLSRATSLDGLIILRPFPLDKITCHHSQDTRQEMKRLEHLDLLCTKELPAPVFAALGAGVKARRNLDHLQQMISNGNFDGMFNLQGPSTIRRQKHPRSEDDQMLSKKRPRLR